jgi:hypothetical protein
VPPPEIGFVPHFPPPSPQSIASKVYRTPTPAHLARYL